MLGKILVALLVAAGVFLVYSIFASKANAAEGGQTGTGLTDFNKWVSGADKLARTTKDPTVAAYMNYASSLPRMTAAQTNAILAARGKNVPGQGA